MFWNRHDKVKNESNLELKQRIEKIESMILDLYAQNKMIRDKVLRRFKGEDANFNNNNDFNPFTNGIQ